MNSGLQLTICAHREVSVGTFGSVVLMYMKSRIPFYTMVFSGDALIGRSRSRACTGLLESNMAPYMLFVDDDIIFTPEDVEKIYEDLLKGYEIVGGCYPVKDASQLASLPWTPEVDFDADVVAVEYVATGFMGIAKTALQKIKDGLNLRIVNPSSAWAKCYPFFENYGFYDRKGENKEPIYLSEDWDFCEKARKVGMEVYLDMRVRVKHLGISVATVDDAIRNVAEKSIQVDRS